MSRIIIGLSGKAQAGKDTTAQLLQEVFKEKTSNTPYIFSIAASIKELASTYFNWDSNKDLLPDKDKGRNLLINIGLKMKEIRDSVWIDFLLEDDVITLKQNNIVIVPDVRYISDYNGIIKAGGIVLRVERRQGSLDINSVSEKDLDNINFKYKVVNDWDLVTFKTYVRNYIYEEVLKKEFPFITGWEENYKKEQDQLLINKLKYKKEK